MARRRQKKYNRKLRIANTGKPRRGVYKSKRNVIPRTLVATGVGFPRKMLMTHKYSESVGVASTLGVPNSHLWRCNGMFDPNLTGVGGQPLYYDQMAALYDHYVVIGSKIVFTVTPALTTTAASRLTCFINDDTTLTTTTVDAVTEQTQGHKVRIMPAGNNSVVTMTLNWSAKKVFGGSILANTELQGTATSDPSEQSTFAIVVQSDSTTINYLVNVQITYIAIWKELKDIARS